MINKESNTPFDMIKASEEPFRPSHLTAAPTTCVFT